MNIRGIFLLFILSSLLLISGYLYLFAKPLYLEYLERERIANIQRVSMKEYPKKRKKRTLQRTVLEAEEKIQKLLERTPIPLGTDFISSKDRIVLKPLINILNNINEDVILTIATYNNKDASASKNLKRSQKRADMLKEYIRKRSQVLFITSIGYGEEFPLLGTNNNTTDRPVEIHLKRIK